MPLTGVFQSLFGLQWAFVSHNKKMKIPTDKQVLSAIFERYKNDYVAFDKNNSIRSTKIYVPINCQDLAQDLKSEGDIIFGRLYYHLEHKYGYEQQGGTKVHFFTLGIANKDKHCVNFPLLTSVLADLTQEGSRFWLSTFIAAFSLGVSVASIAISLLLAK